MRRSEPVRVLVVDDSAFMRKLLTDILLTSAAIEVVGSAKDGFEAVELASKLKPDVITLDVEMPGRSGLETLPALFAVREVPVVMVSALTQEGAAVTLEALELGAFDFLPKPAHHQVAELKALGNVLIGKVLAAAQSRVRRPPVAVPPRPSQTPSHQDFPAAPPAVSFSATEIVVIGISTGGPQALGQAFMGLVPPIPPILVVQHMPAGFTQVFAERLGRHCSLTVKQADDGDRVLPDQILIAPGGRHMTLIGRAPAGPGRNLRRPAHRRSQTFDRRPLPLGREGLRLGNRRYHHDRDGTRRRRRLQENTCRRRDYLRPG